MKKLCFAFVCSLIMASSMCVYGEQSVITNIVLLATDVGGLETNKMLPVSWYYGEDINNQILKKTGVAQSAHLNETKIYVRYAEFSSDIEAQQAISYTVNDVSTRLKKGIWEEATQKKIGDVSWYDNNWETSLFVANKKICFYVDCDNSNETIRKTLCEQLALKIIEKIEQGGSVIVSNENPPPATKIVP